MVLTLLCLLSTLADATPDVAAGPPVEQVKGQPVRLGDTVVFEVRGPRAGKPIEHRVRDAAATLGRAMALSEEPVVRFVVQGDTATLLVADMPLIELGAEDAVLAGEAQLETYAARLSGRVREVLTAERRRASISKAVFSFSLAVFFGLIAFYLIRRLSDLAERARLFLEQKPDRELSLHIRRIEVMSPATVRSTGELATSLGKWLAQLGVVYAWLVITLSMFEATRDYTQRLTGFVLSPLSTLMERVASALPLMLVVLLAGLAVLVLVRYVDLFFKSVGRGETPLPWLPAELAAPASLIVRAAIVVAALVFGAPVVIGEGALGRTGALTLLTVALASTPVLASAVTGAALLFGRRLRLGDVAEIGDKRGRIVGLSLLETRLRDDDQTEIRIPHLLALVRPMRVLGKRPRASFDLRVPTSAAHAELVPRLESVAAQHAKDVTVEVCGIELTNVHYRVTCLCDGPTAKTALSLALLEAIQPTPPRPVESVLT